MRTAFIEELCELAAIDKKVFLLCGDLGFSVLEVFADRFPDRFMNVGISEQNMIQVASGLALEGYNVFVYSIGNFPTLRCMEQIRYDVCYHNLNVTIVAVGAGYAYGPLGVSHHTTEDIAMMRSIPNMLVAAPGDPWEARLITRYFVQNPGPGYMRVNKAGELAVHSTCSLGAIEPGSLLPIKEGVGTAVVSTGAILDSIVSQLDAEGLRYGVFSCPFVSRLDRDGLMDILKRYNQVITVEEHQLSGGFGSFFLEEINHLHVAGLIDEFPLLRRVGIPDIFQGFAGTQDFLREKADIRI